MVEGSGHAKTTATDLQSVDSTVSALPPSGLAALDSAVRDGVGSLNSAASYTLDSFTTPAPLGDEERAASDLQTGLADLDLAVRITNATSGP